MSYFLLPATNLEQIKPHGNQLIKWSRLIRDRDLAGLVIIRFTYTACIGILWGFLPIFADAAFSLSSSSIGILVTTGVFFSGLLQIPMGYLADRVNRKLMIFWGGMLTAGAIFSLNWADGFQDLLFANIAFGLGGGIAMPPIMALAVIKGNQTGAMGSVMALLTVAHSLGMLVGSLLAGFTMDLFHLREAFFLGAVMMSFGVASFLFFTHSGKMKEQTDMQQS
jgi:MFS family permease